MHILNIYATANRRERQLFLLRLLDLSIFQHPLPQLIVLGDLNYHHYTGAPSAPDAWRHWLHQHLTDVIVINRSAPMPCLLSPIHPLTPPSTMSFQAQLWQQPSGV
jgi:hypothetical protein